MIFFFWLSIYSSICVHVNIDNVTANAEGVYNVLQRLATVRFRRWPIFGAILRDVNGFFHRCQQTITTFTSKGRAKTFWSSNQKPHDNIGILLYTFTWPHKMEDTQYKTLNGRDELNNMK